MSISEDIIRQFSKLTGQNISDNSIKKIEGIEGCYPFKSGGLGYSQFNELLLTFGYDRVTKDFFKWVFEDDASIASLDELKRGVDKFCKISMILYGHIKYGFKLLSQMEKSAIKKELKSIKPLKESHYTNRHEPLHEISPIPPKEAYYLGYIIEGEIDKELKKNPENEEYKKKKENMEDYRQIGKKNHDYYLVSDHMDVYIATSMRERSEFTLVGEFVEKLFQDDSLKHLKLRYFNPTQAYCKNRIDKGLVEGLMLKRARCTIYHVQESDTIGKDSELAATLAQGKPVIAYVPKIED